MEEEEYENYIEINEETLFPFNDWVYDTILNRTLKELTEENLVDLMELIQEGKREANGYLSLVYLEKREFKLLYRNMTRAYNRSIQAIRKTYLRKANNRLLREFKLLIDSFVKDDRFTE